jgi:uncharacterized protein with von Willebrand factor type A (vWA) domain
MSEGVAALVGFGEALRLEGVPAGPARIQTFCEAAAVLAPEELYWAGRASLVWRREQIPVYDRVFAGYFGSMPEAAPCDHQTPEVLAHMARVRVEDEGEEEIENPTAEGTASRVDLLRTKSFAECTEQEWAEIAGLLARLPELLPMRRTRRYHPGRPGSPHARRILRRAAATGGEPIHIHERRRRVRQRPLIFLLDVSGSMTAHSRGLLLFTHAVTRCNPSTRVYTFGTRLTEITNVVAMPSFETALRLGGSIVPDWDGGTRIGDALQAFLARCGRLAETRRAITVIWSDGLDTGDPAVLATQAERLHGLVHRLMWLNPLKADPRYEPLTRGMQAALPHVDIFESGHSIASLLSVFAQLEHSSRG